MDMGGKFEGKKFLIDYKLILTEHCSTNLVFFFLNSYF